MSLFLQLNRRTFAKPRHEHTVGKSFAVSQHSLSSHCSVSPNVPTEKLQTHIIMRQTGFKNLVKG